MRWLRFIFSHSIFISFCAAALCFQTSLLLHVEINVLSYLLVFCSTLCSYNFYWLLSKFRFSDRKNIFHFLQTNMGNVLLAIISSVGVLLCCLKIPAVIPYLVAGMLFTLLYSLPLWPFKFFEQLAKWGFMKTLLLALTWTYVTSVIPSFQHLNIDFSFILLFIARFSFMLMLCTIFDSRDISVDKIHGLRSLATDVHGDILKWIMIFLFGIYITAGIILRMYFESNIQLISFIINGIFVLYIYHLSRQKQGYFFYYFLVDGLMLFSSVSTYVATIL